MTIPITTHNEDHHNEEQDTKRNLVRIYIVYIIYWVLCGAGCQRGRLDEWLCRKLLIVGLGFRVTWSIRSGSANEPPATDDRAKRMSLIGATLPDFSIESSQSHEAATTRPSDAIGVDHQRLQSATTPSHVSSGRQVPKWRKSCDAIAGALVLSLVSGSRPRDS